MKMEESIRIVGCSEMRTDLKHEKHIDGTGPEAEISIGIGTHA